MLKLLYVAGNSSQFYSLLFPVTLSTCFRSPSMQQLDLFLALSSSSCRSQIHMYVFVFVYNLCVLASWFLYQLKIVFCGKDLDWAPLLLSVNSWLTHIRKTCFPCPTNVSVPVLSVKDLPLHWQRPRFLSPQFQLGVMSVIKFIYLCFFDNTTTQWLKYDMRYYY